LYNNDPFLTKNRRKVVRYLLLLPLLLLALPAAADLVNGSFEPAGSIGGYLALPGGSTAIPGWVTTDSGVEWFLPGTYGDTAAPSGQYIVDIANYVYSAGGVAQTFTTVPGSTYQVTFSLGTSQSYGRDGTCEIVVSADGATQTFAAVNHAAMTVYTQHTFTFVADDATATLSLRCLQNANLHFAYIDGVGTGEIVATEAQTWGAIKSLYR
jgi:hypothetical protein